MIIDRLLEKNVIPDSLLRLGIRFLLKNTIKSHNTGTEVEKQTRFDSLIAELNKSPIAINTNDANEQHYEVPAQFYKIVLGPWLKYSSGYWFKENHSLHQSEEDMLLMTIDRADIQSGQQVLDLGCGWGSFSLYAAENFPKSQFTAVSNSASQKEFIDQKAKERGITNLRVITDDINDFDPETHFDRIVSVEMFEHVRNYGELFSRLNQWLKDDGKLFVHIFSHKEFAYKFEAKNEGDWMARHFFTGGIMPSHNLLFNFSGQMKTLKEWRINGNHYAKTLAAWLELMDANQKEIMQIFNDTYGNEASKFWSYWRIFFMACIETFAYNNGEEWGISHYLFQKIN